MVCERAPVSALDGRGAVGILCTHVPLRRARIRVHVLRDRCRWGPRCPWSLFALCRPSSFLANPEASLLAVVSVSLY